MDLFKNTAISESGPFQKNTQKTIGATKVRREQNAKFWMLKTEEERSRGNRERQIEIWHGHLWMKGM